MSGLSLTMWSGQVYYIPILGRRTSPVVRWSRLLVCALQLAHCISGNMRGQWPTFDYLLFDNAVGWHARSEPFDTLIVLQLITNTSRSFGGLESALRVTFLKKYVSSDVLNSLKIVNLKNLFYFLSTDIDRCLYLAICWHAVLSFHLHMSSFPRNWWLQMLRICSWW